MTRTLTRLAGLALVALLALAAPAAADAAKKKPRKPKTVEVQLLGFNDFHGHLEATTPGTISPTGGTADRVAAGGAEYLATHIRRLSRYNRNTLVVSAGDLIGASPLLSALFHDEPTIEAWNRIGLDMNAIGNHEFDEGVAELRRMQEGGCHPVDGCQDGTPFRGADFPFLSANVVDEDTGRPAFTPYVIRRFQGVRIGFIGLTLRGTPDIVSPAGVAGVDFLDEAETANRYARELERRGVDAIVTLLHEGGTVAAGGINACNNLTGPVVDIVERTTDEVDLFLTGHTHSTYNCVVDGRPVTSAASFGRLLTDIDLEVDRRSGEIVEVVANNRIVTQDVMRAPDITQLIERYQTLAAPLRDRVIGRLSAPVTRTSDDSGESAAGNLIADAQLAATDDPGTGAAVAAFMNPGGVRSDFDAGDVTYGEAFTVQPFGNSLVTQTYTGAQILEVLKAQWCGQTSARILLAAGVTYSFSAAGAAAITNQPCAGAANPVSDVRIGGAPLDPAATYRVTVNSFLADGGDRFPVLAQGTNRLGGAVDTDALEAYLTSSLTGTPLTPPATDRITPLP